MQHSRFTFRKQQNQARHLTPILSSKPLRSAALSSREYRYHITAVSPEPKHRQHFDLGRDIDVVWSSASSPSTPPALPSTDFSRHCDTTYKPWKSSHAKSSRLLDLK